MRAITIERYGGPEVVLLHEVEIPRPGPGEVLVKVAFAGINFMDIHTRQGKYASSRSYPVHLPCTLGMEGAGVVAATGAGVTRVKPGDQVAWCISWGAYAEYACVPEARLAKVPDGLPLDAAAASLFQGCTAHYLINDVAHLVTGSTCLIHAASGSIGQILIQMAKSLGAFVFATASTPDKREVAARLGADHAMAYDEGRFADLVRRETAGKGVDVVFDSVGRATLRDSMRATRVRGLVINYGNVSGSVTDLDPMELGEAGSLFITRPRLADHMADAESVQRRADAVFGALLRKALAIPIVARYSLDNVYQAHRRIESREQIGKAVLEIDGLADRRESPAPGQ
jgi:NADPH2:quinone reductase